MRILTIFLMVLMTVVSCTQQQTPYNIIDPTSFKGELNGKALELFTLTNSHDMTVQITNYGARIVSIWVKGKDGSFADVNLGFKSADNYLNANGTAFGAMIGRYANRIAKGRFVVEEDTIQLALNNGVNNIHGGPEGFNKKVWDFVSSTSNKLELSYLSENGDQGFPGALKINVVYELTEDNALKISTKATTDKTTVINICNHAFFNLAGEGSGTALDHQLYINADYYTPLDSVQIPTGEIAAVSNTPYDFKKAIDLGARINKPFDQLIMGKGYDINFVLNKEEDELSHAATLTEPISGRVMEVYTTEPGMQLYTANYLNGSDTGKFGKPLKRRESVCLETQHFPDSPNQSHFPSTVLRPDDTFESLTIFKFSVKE
ncbi:aldose epimerase family protein [Labilibacter marinus]|uniref:aldose epimerase family protein n=1 Tax=Labilibacter marinus TaxID=1477105 RepID=UPI00094FC83B|nr:aldose epimerase family protein [Labilibacter marinus]